MHRRDLHKYSKIGMVAILIILILDAINICSILSIPFNNFNLDNIGCGFLVQKTILSTTSGLSIYLVIWFG